MRKYLKIMAHHSSTLTHLITSSNSGKKIIKTFVFTAKTFVFTGKMGTFTGVSCLGLKRK